jgi:transglutaminase-like putative cysteine protease
MINGDKMTKEALEQYLLPTYYIDSDSETVTQLVDSIGKGLSDESDKAKAIFYWVRDKILYDVHSFSPDKSQYKASAIIKNGAGWCVPKACLLAALSRAMGIPSRLHFADIRNYQITDKLLEEMGTNIFYFHGYTELYLNNNWIKVTPAFNKELCEKFSHKTVEFDGVHDALLPTETISGEKHVEYLNDRGVYLDLPFEEMLAVFAELYASDTPESSTFLEQDN